MEIANNDDEEVEVDVEVASNDELERQAVSEIMREAERAAERAKEMGATGWMKPKIPSTNKTFLRNTLVSTLRDPYKKKKKPYNDFTGKSHDRTDNERFQHKSPYNYHPQKWRDKPYDHQQGNFSQHLPGYGYDPQFDPRYRPDTVPGFNYAPDYTEPRTDPRLDYKPAKGYESDSLSSFTDESRHTPEGGYVYDAYEYSFQGTKEPPKPKSKEDKSVSNGREKDKNKSTNLKHNRTGSNSSRHKHKKRRHTSSESSGGSYTNSCKSRKRKRTSAISESSEDSYYESKKRKKSKKKHKHKSKHKSKHRKKRSRSK